MKMATLRRVCVNVHIAAAWAWKEPPFSSSGSTADASSVLFVTLAVLRKMVFEK